MFSAIRSHTPSTKTLSWIVLIFPHRSSRILSSSSPSSKSRSRKLASLSQHTTLKPKTQERYKPKLKINHFIIWSSIFLTDTTVFADTITSITMYLLVLLLSIYLLYLILYFGQPLVNIIVITMARHYELCLWRGGRCAVITEPACRIETGEQLVSWRAVSFGL